MSEAMRIYNFLKPGTGNEHAYAIVQFGGGTRFAAVRLNRLKCFHCKTWNKTAGQWSQNWRRLDSSQVVRVAVLDDFRRYDALELAP